MKKNLLSVMILALLIGNIGLTAIMMFSVTDVNKKTAAVVGDIAAVLQLEIVAPAEEGEGSAEATYSMEDTETYNVAEGKPLTVPLVRGVDGEDHYMITSVSLSINMKDEDYEKFGGANMTAKDTLIQAEIRDVVQQYTIDEVRTNEADIRDEILTEIQTMYNSKFIYKVSFYGVMYQ